uniref:Transcription factor 20 n=1 Tax=Schistocephalus solidus TaxID=70667 RepID=A0A0V0J5U1_SCHSO
MENMHATLSGPVYPPEEGRSRSRPDRDLKIQRATLNSTISGQPTAHPPGGILNSHPLNQPPNITLNERLRNEINICRGDESSALYVSVKNSHGTISPLPPALSPASLSPANSSNFNSSRASPAPPVIADEDELRPSLPYVSAHPNRPTAPPNLTSSVDGPSKSTDYDPFEKRTRIQTQSSSCTSESTSSSTSTSSSCEDVPLRPSRTNGIPILEKMSVSLIAPKVEPAKITPTMPSPAQNSPAAILIDSSMCSIATKVPAVCSPTKEAASTDIRALHSVGAKTEVKVELSAEPSAAASQATAKKRRPPTKRKRAAAKRWKHDSESDFEFDVRLGPRRARNAVNLVKSVKEKAKSRTSRNAKGKTDSKLPSVAELASRRRYLESPFFCLCQSSSSSEAVGVPGGSGEATKDVLGDLPSSMPAHVVNPALKDCSSTFYSLGDPRVTSLCPLLQEQNAGKVGVGNKNALCSGGACLARDRTTISELQSFFANSFYKPTLRPNVRDTRLPATYSDSACGAWCCVFCGEDPDFLLMGPLYGPYFLAEPTASKLLAQQTGDSPQQSAALSALPPDLVITCTSPRKPSGGNSEVVSSAVTRSSAAAAAANPTRPVVAANTGGLRLVIKALSPTLTGSVVVSSVKSCNSGGGSSSSNSSVAGRGRKSGASSGRRGSSGSKRAKSAAQPPAPSSPPPPPSAPARLRIGLGGEVWFHFECVLWASGTSIHGDGNIGGLEDVVSMALEAACSHCKKPGPILSCRSRGCGLCYHFNCARLAECHFNTEQFTVLCKKHFVYS